MEVFIGSKPDLHVERTDGAINPIELIINKIAIPSDSRISITFIGRLHDVGAFAPPNDYKFIIQALYDIPKTVGTGYDEKTTTSVINFTVRP